MSQTIELESLRRVDIKPGETLVAAVPRGYTEEALHRMHSHLTRGLPHGVNVLIVADDVDLSVVAGPDPVRALRLAEATRRR